MKMATKNNTNQGRALFFFIGLSLSLGLVILVFEWGFETDSESNLIVEKGSKKEFDDPSNQNKIIKSSFNEFNEHGSIPSDLDCGPTFGNSEDSVITIAQPASPVGGMGTFYEYIKQNLKLPKETHKNRVDGKVFVGFVVNAAGELTEMKVLRGIDEVCDAEAVRLLKSSPKWNPARNDEGVIVPQRLIMPIIFRH